MPSPVKRNATEMDARRVRARRLYYRRLRAERKRMEAKNAYYKIRRVLGVAAAHEAFAQEPSA